MDSLIVQLLGGAVTAAIGFVAAYLLAKQQRRWDAETAAATTRAALIQSVRIPLEIIRDEIRTAQALYFTHDVEDRISRALREAIYGLRDEGLIREFERALAPLRELAASSSSADRKSLGEKCMPHIEAMLTRLAELDVKTAAPRRWSWPKRPALPRPR